MQYAAFGAIYYWLAENCVPGIKHFAHGFHFSVQSSATIGTRTFLACPIDGCQAPKACIMIWLNFRSNPAGQLAAVEPISMKFHQSVRVNVISGMAGDHVGVSLFLEPIELCVPKPRAILSKRSPA
jgi:hypothetical protein